MYLVSIELEEEICVINEYQRRGTTFPVAIKTNGNYEHTFALMDTGASRSCINYTMFLKIRNPSLVDKIDSSSFHSGWQ